MRFNLLVSSLFCLLAAAGPISPRCDHDDNLTVETDLFTVKGAISPNSSLVRVFKGVPYAEPPVGSLRFRPPVTKKPESGIIDATSPFPICLQWGNVAPSVYTEYVTGDEPYPNATQSEDCLYLNIWTPLNATSKSNLAVMIWIHGGGYTTGSADQGYKNGAFLAQNQNIIVVSVEYRLNIFGFVNAPALDGVHLNPGFLDQRKAVEFVYNHIRPFGGNPEQMIIFGQSAGSSSVDLYTYAWNTDPIVKGFISESGQANPPIGTQDPTGTNFTYIAEQLNCTSNPDKDAVFQCMQSLPAEAIVKFSQTYNSSLNGGKSLSFQPQIDNSTLFGNYTDRQLRGLYAEGAYLTGSNDNEDASLYTPFIISGPNETVIKQVTDKQFTCPTMVSAARRSAAGRAQWRYYYRGVWPNTNPLPWLMSYHSSEIPQVWGTADYDLGPSTPAEAAFSAYVQTAWAMFAKDPQNGLTNYGWPKYDPSKLTLIQLGYNNATTAEFVNHTVADNECSLPGHEEFNY